MLKQVIFCFSIIIISCKKIDKKYIKNKTIKNFSILKQNKNLFILGTIFSFINTSKSQNFGPIIQTDINGSLCQIEVIDLNQITSGFPKIILDGLNPIISFFLSPESINIMKCFDPVCINKTIKTIDNSSTFDTELYSIDKIDDNPVLCYTDTVNNILKLAFCIDPICENVLIKNLTNFGVNPSMKIDLNSDPVIFYAKNGPASGMFLISCDPPFCNTFSNTLIRSNITSTNDLVLFNDMIPLLIYSISGSYNNSLIYALCNDNICTVKTEFIVAKFNAELELVKINLNDNDIIYISYSLINGVISGPILNTCNDLLCTNLSTINFEQNTILIDLELSTNDPVLLSILPFPSLTSNLIYCFFEDCNQFNRTHISNLTTFSFQILDRNPIIISTDSFDSLYLLSCDNFTFSPSITPTIITFSPTFSPSSSPSVSPSIPTFFPTMNPSIFPTISPSLPTFFPSQSPTNTPTNIPTTPSFNPTNTPSVITSNSPTINPISIPSIMPTEITSLAPTLSTSNASGLGLGIIFGLFFILLFLILIIRWYFKTK